MEHPWRETALMVGLAVALTLIFFHRAVLSDWVFIDRDTQRVYYPLHQYWAERVARGEWPVWYPYDGLGQPFVSMLISGALHPGNLLYLVLPLGLAMKVNTLVCFPLALCGAWLFARRWGASVGASALAGGVFTFSGYMVSITNNLPYLMTASAFPWALWGADRLLERPSPGRAVGSALLLSLVLLGGDSQSFCVCSALVVVLALARGGHYGRARSALVAGGLLLLTALYTSAQTLPALAAAAQVHVSRQSLEEALSWSTPPLRWGELVLGPVFGGATLDAAPAIARGLLQVGFGSLWVESLYLGVLTPVLVGVGLWAWRRRWEAWLLAALVLGLGLLQMGRWAPLYALVYKLVPLWRSFRYPEKLFPYVAFLLALAAAAGLQALQASQRVRQGAVVALAGLSVAALALGWAEASWQLITQGLASLWQGAAPQAALALLHEQWAECCRVAGLSGLAVAAVLWLLRAPALRVWAVGAATYGSLFLAHERLYILAPPELLDTPNGFVEVIRQHGPAGLGGSRIASLVDAYNVEPLPGLDPMSSHALSAELALRPVIGARWGLETYSRYLPASSRRVVDTFLESSPLETLKQVGLWSVRYIVMSASTYSRLGGSVSAVLAERRDLGLVLLHNPQALPRAYLARPRCVPAGGTALELLSSPDFNATREAAVECNAPLRLTEGGELGQARILSYAPELVVVQARVKQPSVLVLNDSFYPGWRAWVDGRPAPILPANHAVRAVVLGEGEHQVVFHYRSTPLEVGAAISLGALVLSLGAVALAAWRQRR